MTVDIQRVIDPRELESVADWFASQLRLEPDYISHSEVLWGRARNADEWSSDLEAVVRREFEHADSDVFRAVARVDNELAALICTRFVSQDGAKFLVLEDLIVAPGHRRTGLARLLVREAERAAEEFRADWLVLESGWRNAGAHKFFESLGYAPISQTMMKPVA
ncbi:MAG: GNAT family N-acetyltransferase [Alphaproteobacteria bacterium]|nr:GNAT family N-acetyltransferase [Alphaproteobacteria bacterium]